MSLLVNKNLSTLLQCLLPFIIYFFVHSNDGARGVGGSSCKGGVVSSGVDGGGVLVTSAPAKYGPPPSFRTHAAAAPLNVLSGYSRAPALPLPTLPSLTLWGEGEPLQALRGTCYMLRPSTHAPVKPGEPGPDDMLYEMCFGDRIKQIQHPVLGRSLFGTFSKFSKTGESNGDIFATQLYEGGTVCPGFGMRGARVDFTCDQAAVQTPILLSVLEPQVCQYVLKVSTIHACGGG